MKKLISILLISILTFSLIGCGGNDEFDINAAEAELVPSPTPKRTTTLENSMFYIKHSDGTYEQLYLGKHTFSTGSSQNTANPSRVVWFQDDFGEIPTLYTGDQLVYFSNDFIPYNYYFERFFDNGYSIGLANVKVDQTGRFFFTADKSDERMYAYSDADQFLYLTNEKLIIESIGGLRCRCDPDQSDINNEALTASEVEIINEYKRYYENQGTEFNLSGVTLSNANTLQFSENPNDTIKIRENTYTFQIMDGTTKKDVDIQTNIRVLVSGEVRRTSLFDFDMENNIIVLPIPDSFNDGYYLMNGLGMFRYVKTGTSFDPDDANSFNIPNDYTDDTITTNSNLDELENNKGNLLDENSTGTNPSSSYTSSSRRSSSDNTEKLAVSNGYAAYISVVKTGKINLSITFTDTVEGGVSDPKDITATITAPNGDIIQTSNNAGVISASFNAKETGKYKITYTNLGTLLPQVAVTSQ